MSARKSDTGHRAGSFSRRALVGFAATAATVSVVHRRVLGGDGQEAPSDRLNIAGIGVGGRGAEDLHEMRGQNVVALADVDDAQAAATFKRFPGAKRYRDFRKMLEAEGKGIDAVVVACPDHVHAVASMAALRMKKHVYCEKPLTHTIHECRAVAQAAREAGVATQMGNQGMAFEGNRLIKEWLWAGAIGPVREVHVWSNRPTYGGKIMWPQGVERPQDTPPVPPALDWDLWLGPAPQRPYHPAYVPFRWRGWWDFGTGPLGDMGSHNLAPVFSALGLVAPTSVDASSSLVNAETVPLACTAHLRFPARPAPAGAPPGEMPPVTVHWYDGGLIPARPEELEPGKELDREDGILFVGDKGKMLVEGWGGERPRLLPESLHKEFPRPPKTLPRSIGHHQEWIRACKEKTPTESSFAFAGPLIESTLLALISVRVMQGAGDRGRNRLEWDAAAMKVTNLPKANDYLHYEYRKGWTL
jgi:predicted dehydrogenase